MKKIKLGFVLILMIQTLIVNSQDYIPFPSDSASWKIVEYHFGDCNPASGNCNSVYNFFVSGDTIMNNNKYTRLYLVDGNSIGSQKYLGGFREDSSKKVFYRGNIFFSNYECDSIIPDTTDILLYDFGLSIGDSIKNINFYCAREWIYDIDSVDYAGRIRKRYAIARGSSEDNYWIEGVGSTKGIFYPILNWFEQDWSLTCFADNVPNWRTSICLLPVMVNTDISVDDLNIYPNPMIDESVIEWDINMLTPDLIDIYSTMGERIISIKPVSNKVILNRSIFLHSGLYLVNLKTDNKNITKRLIVE